MITYLEAMNTLRDVDLDSPGGNLVLLEKLDELYEMSTGTSPVAVVDDVDEEDVDEKFDEDFIDDSGNLTMDEYQEEDENY